ncbi:MAG: peptide-methionine (S)-S-oxide reductase MsrA [Anaerolineaceae bacterium]|nr:peptide-methionine (S)-S-oxide reductase MsrA [Anaerolineaceae bacterium]
MNKKIATFGAGCFWGVQAKLSKIEGVIDTVVGYTGGSVNDPDYHMVCTDRTGHAEAVQVTYDQDVLSYEHLVQEFWRIHDPTTPDRQGPDYGSQYRSVIFFHDEEQKEKAEQVKVALDNAKLFRYPIVTEIVPASKFYNAEEYHQRYYEKHGLSYC